MKIQYINSFLLFKVLSKKVQKEEFKRRAIKSLKKIQGSFLEITSSDKNPSNTCITCVTRKQIIWYSYNWYLKGNF
jgi:hypothetical protein